MHIKKSKWINFWFRKATTPPFSIVRAAFSGSTTVSSVIFDPFQITNLLNVKCRLWFVFLFLRRRIVWTNIYSSTIHTQRAHFFERRHWLSRTCCSAFSLGPQYPCQCPQPKPCQSPQPCGPASSIFQPAAMYSSRCSSRPRPRTRSRSMPRSEQVQVLLFWDYSVSFCQFSTSS